MFQPRLPVISSYSCLSIPEAIRHAVPAPVQYFVRQVQDVLPEIERKKTVELAPWSGKILELFGLSDWIGIPPAFITPKNWPGLPITTQGVLAHIAGQVMERLPKAHSGKDAEDQFVATYRTISAIAFTLAKHSSEVRPDGLRTALMTVNTKASKVVPPGTHAVFVHIGHFTCISRQGAAFCAKYPEHPELICKLTGRSDLPDGDTTEPLARRKWLMESIKSEGLSLDGLFTIARRGAFNVICDKPNHNDQRYLDEIAALVS